MGRVQKHNAAQFYCGRSGVNLAAEPFSCQKRNLAGMVNMGMGQQYIINLRWCKRQRAVFIDIRALFHAAVHQNGFAAGRDDGT